jgi:hypothetical protein
MDKAWPRYMNVHWIFSCTVPTAQDKFEAFFSEAWLLYLNLKLSSVKLSHFSNTYGLLVQK